MANRPIPARIPPMQPLGEPRLNQDVRFQPPTGYFVWAHKFHPNQIFHRHVYQT